jgi:hypothetical protein
MQTTWLGSKRRSAPIEPKQRVVLLGASNLTRGISTVVRLAQLAFDGPLEVLAALGAGRSYGMASRVLVRELPGIEGCGLWDALAGVQPLPTAALVTDIGNDIFYGATVEQIVSWVNRALDRLSVHEARIVMTLLPADNARQISAWRFRLMRRVMFRNCTLELDEVQEAILAINERLGTIARERSIQLVAQRAEWYGIDPIHIRIDRWPRAWSEILSTWRLDSEKNFSPAPSLSRWFYLRSLPPLERTLFGRVQRARQPSGRLADGTTIAFY